MKLTITPGQPLRGTLRLPGDKSLSHRAALFAALAEGESRIENFLDAGVTQAMLHALIQLGICWDLDANHVLKVSGGGLKGFKPPQQALDCGNSATTLRLLAGAIACSGVAATLDGSPGLRRRPMQRIVKPLQLMGVPIQASAQGTAPLQLEGRFDGQKLIGQSHKLNVASAQVKSCLLLAGLDADSPTEVIEPAASRDHTERMLRLMGVNITQSSSNDEGSESCCQLISPQSRLHPLNIRLPGDISSAAFFIVAALITPGSEILIENVLINPGRTGVIEVLQSMGAQIEITPQKYEGWEPVGNIHIAYSPISGGDVAGELVVRMIDEFPAFAVAAAYAQGETRVREATELRTKESDRIQALAELVRLGGQITEHVDGFDVLGRERLEGGEANPHGDHRMAMALAIAGLAARQPVNVNDAEIITESFPGFVDSLQSLGAQVEVSQ